MGTRPGARRGNIWPITPFVAAPQRRCASRNAEKDHCQQYGTTHVRIAGYADARGSDAANAALGKARADAVKAGLVAQGIAGDRIETVSGGESDPVGTNATASGQAENRRTELVVTSR